jgi:hypothetical protein
MYYTVSDFYNTFQDKVTLLCGAGGLSQRITSAGVVDYEFVPELKGKYRYTAFRRNELEVTSLLYAKDNPYLVEDTIKQLITAGTSGLVIKNVFHLQIPDGAIRYANARNFPLFLTTCSGIRSCDPKLLEVGRSLGFSKTQLIRHIQLPAALEAIVTGLQLSLGYSWRALIGAELIAASAGIGYLILDAEEMSRPDIVLAGMLCIGIIGSILDWVFLHILQRLIPWYQKK